MSAAPHPADRRIVIVLAAIVALAVALVVAARTERPLGPTVVLPSATAAPTPTAPSSPTSTPTPTIAPPPTPFSPPGFPSVLVAPLGTVRGDLVFGTRGVAGASSPMTELWAIPLANGAAARAVVRYPGHGTPWLSSRISADGRRFAFAMDRGDRVTRIAIADLFTGAVSWLRTDASAISDGEPAWDPSGTRIAIARSDMGPRGQGSVWVANVDGTGMRQIVPPANGPTYVHQWTPDGKSVAFYQGVGYDTVDVATGARVHMERVISADASWRRATPSLVVTGWEGDLHYIFAMDALGVGSRDVLVRARDASEFITGPRWRPDHDEFLYTSVDTSTQPSRFDLRVRSLSGGERSVAAAAAFPTWTSDGSAIVYVRSEQVPQPGQGEGGSTLIAIVNAEIHAVNADGTGDRLLYRIPSDAGELPPSWCVCNDGLATRRY